MTNYIEARRRALRAVATLRCENDITEDRIDARLQYFQADGAWADVICAADAGFECGRAAAFEEAAKMALKSSEQWQPGSVYHQFAMTLVSQIRSLPASGKGE